MSAGVNASFADGYFTDGNSLAGPLRELFAVDVTAATAPCAGCGQVNAVGQLRVYAGPQAPGLVARCPGCETVVLRVVRGPATAWLDLTGSGTLRIPLPG
jgi:hypothetical protein